MGKEQELNELQKQFHRDTQTVANQAEKFVRMMYPAYSVSTKTEAMNYMEKDAGAILEAFQFYRIFSCTTEHIEDAADYLSEKMSRLFTVLHSFGCPVAYGAVSYQGTTSLVIGVYDKKNEALSVRKVMEGMLSGIEMSEFSLNLSGRKRRQKEAGVITGVPSLILNGEKQHFDLSPLLKSLNGKDYTVLFVARPASQKCVLGRYEELVNLRDQCAAVSKRTVSMQKAETKSDSYITGHAETDTVSRGITFGLMAKLFTGSLTAQKSYSETKSVSLAVTDAVNHSAGVSYDVQNGLALELIGYADKAIERFRQGTGNGMWETALLYETDSWTAAGIIRACISGGLSQPDPQLLPCLTRQYHLEWEEAGTRFLLLPQTILNERKDSLLCTLLTSEELGWLCTLPYVPVPDFELKAGRMYPLVTDRKKGAYLGNVCDGRRELSHMPFSLSHEDLAKHTFVCGITGSGKTNTVKRILQDAGMPFLVIESAKKEYRNLLLKGGKEKNNKADVYTLGKPELHCLRMNPFYIPCGISPQQHIDYLKDLFQASFSFYGPMPYILEQCLHKVYREKGWNLTLGIHPYLSDTTSEINMFNQSMLKEKYSMKTHKYLFPTMQDLKEEVERYIETEMNYEGETAGNIKTAIKARLQSLCSGSKGFMFNTYEYADMPGMMNRNIVFELEGLADDSDKAFCVGLLIIFINEYWQTAGEIAGVRRKLNHLLVIEEAHRLLKNVDTERSTEYAGNPKGKAVEHFTNMIAEMRSYGQGVIIAEQIPSKLAPDVVKNSSNKIIQRLVSADEQMLVANTAGMRSGDAIYIGNLKTGMALCHKEGMNLPVCVHIVRAEGIDVSDRAIYDRYRKGRLFQINCSQAKEAVQAKELDKWGFQLLNAVLMQDAGHIQAAVRECREKIRSKLSGSSTALVIIQGDDDRNDICAELLSIVIFRYLLWGTHSIGHLIENEGKRAWEELLRHPEDQACIGKVKRWLREAYEGEDPSYQGKLALSRLIKKQARKKRKTGIRVDAAKTAERCFFQADEKTVKEIQSMAVRR